MFEKATRLKLRFSTSRGIATVEDLWDLPLQSKDGFDLDSLALQVNEELKLTNQSFVAPKSKEDSALSLKLEILKHIIAVKLQEANERENEMIRKTKKEHILSIIKDKQAQALREKSIEELEQELNTL